MGSAINDIFGSFSLKEISRFFAFREVIVPSRVNTTGGKFHQTEPPFESGISRVVE